jgi:hypothetical protein
MPGPARPGEASIHYANAKGSSAILAEKPKAAGTGQPLLPFVTQSLTLDQERVLKDAAQRSVVLVTSERSEGVGIGSGVIVGESAGNWVIATATHVAGPPTERGPRFVNIEIAGSPPVQAPAFAAPLPGGNYASDLAFVVVPKSLLPGKSAVAVAAPTSMRESGKSKLFVVGTELLQAGYPADQRGIGLDGSRTLLSEKLVGNWLRITEFRPVFVGNGQVPARSAAPYSKGQGLGTTKSLNHGSSGGPLFGIENSQPVLFGITSIKADGPPVRQGMGGAQTPTRTHSATRAFHIGADFIQPSLQEFLRLAAQLQILVRP